MPGPGAASARERRRALEAVEARAQAGSSPAQPRKLLAREQLRQGAGAAPLSVEQELDEMRAPRWSPRSQKTFIEAPWGPPPEAESG